MGLSLGILHPHLGRAIRVHYSILQPPRREEGAIDRGNLSRSLSAQTGRSPAYHVLGFTRSPLSRAFSLWLHEIDSCQGGFFTCERVSSIKKSHLEEEKLPVLSQEVEGRYQEVSKASFNRKQHHTGKMINPGQRNLQISFSDSTAFGLFMFLLPDLFFSSSASLVSLLHASSTA